ncbi:DUF4395 domain-containing protein [Candidatus Gracilibacteria bacterium]|nr:DUF4395 domain-containing protein [Candidatus Gracilibacteria bacterium]
MYIKEIGSIIPDLEIDGKPAPYGVLNERAVRATAGIMFLVGIITVMYTFFTKDFMVVNFILPLFFLNFIILVLWGPKYSPISKLGSYLVRKQKPDYVGAIQKRFAWTLGLLLSLVVMILIYGFNMTGVVPLILCSICIALMWMESSLGICVGCKIYSYLIKKGILKEPIHRPACLGGVCNISSRTEL